LANTNSSKFLREITIELLMCYLNDLVKKQEFIIKL